MATWKNLPLLLLGLSLLAVSTTARPCKTLFFFTSTSFYPTPHSSKPNPNIFFITTQFRNPSFIIGRNAIFFDRIEEDNNRIGEDEEEIVDNNNGKPVEFYSSSIRDRTKDIMRVMGAMLFGVGCGALTAATMYLIWVLLWPSTTFDYFEDSDGDSDDDDDSAKKIGYVVLPTKVVDDDYDLKKPAKEVV